MRKKYSYKYKVGDIVRGNSGNLWEILGRRMGIYKVRLAYVDECFLDENDIQGRVL